LVAVAQDVEEPAGMFRLGNRAADIAV
jgi:hypothetical protein